MTRGKAAVLGLMAFAAGYCIAWKPSNWRGSGVTDLTVEVSRGFRAIEQRLTAIEARIVEMEKSR